MKIKYVTIEREYGSGGTEIAADLIKSGLPTIPSIPRKSGMT